MGMRSVVRTGLGGFCGGRPYHSISRTVQARLIMRLWWCTFANALFATMMWTTMWSAKGCVTWM